MTARDAVGAVISPEDYVRDLAKGRDHVLRVLTLVGDDKVLLASGVTVKAERVEVVL